MEVQDHHQKQIFNSKMFQEFLDFLGEHYFIPIYFVTLVVSLFKYRGYFDTVLKYYPMLIAYTFFNELLGTLVRTYPSFSFFKNLSYSSYNQIIYNIYFVIFLIFFYSVYWQLISDKSYKKYVKLISFISIFSFVISCIFQNPFETDLFYSVSIGSWVLVLFIGLYFIDKHKRNKKLVQPNNLVFWLSIALLVFYSIFPILFLVGYLDYYTWEKYSLRTVLKILIIVMYGLIIIGFVKGKRRAFE